MPLVALREIAEQLGGELIGDASLRIDRIGALDSATPSTISFLANPRLRGQLATTKAGCLIVAPADRVDRGGRIADQFAAETRCDLAEGGGRLHPVTCRPWR